MLNKLYMDFEFSGTNKKFVDLICCSLIYKRELRSFRLVTPELRKELIDFLLSIREEKKKLVSYGLEAELRSLFSLFGTERLNTVMENTGIEEFVCLHAEHKILANKNTAITHGEVILKGKKTFRKYDDTDNKKVLNLINAIFKFNKEYDEDHAKSKERIRDVCIRNEPHEIHKSFLAIINYCEMDVECLPVLYHNMHFAQPTADTSTQRGKYVAIVAEATQQGYYVNRTQVDNLRKNSRHIVGDICRSINKKWPDEKTFSYKNGHWTFHSSVVEKYIHKSYPGEYVARLPKTEKTGKISVSIPTFEKMFGSKVKQSLKEDDYLQQVYKFLYTRSAISGIVRPKGKGNTKPFEEFLDPTEPIVRPYINPFGSVTGRNQPAANSFLLAKPAWMRVMLTPPPGRENYMICVDCGKEEYLYLAVISGSKGMIDAYASGDPYVDFGLRIGLLNEEMRGTTLWHQKRHIAKATVLMILYGAGPKGLMDTVNASSPVKITEQQAELYIHQFYTQYPEVRQFNTKIQGKYARGKMLVLHDGWTMFGNNYNIRSVLNFPIQGGCAAVYRKAVMYAHEKGIVINMGQHDSFITYAKEEDLYGKAGQLCMSILDAFKMVLGHAPGSELLTLDIKVIGQKKPNFSEIRIDKTKFPVKFDYKYNDERAAQDLKQFGRYLND